MSDFVLSLHHLNALDMPHAEFIACAGSLGCDMVSLFAYEPERARGLYPLFSDADVPKLRETLAKAGIGLCNLEVFPLDGQEDWAGYERALARGSALGARRATVSLPTLPDLQTGVARFIAFCELAARHDIIAGLEFHAFAAVSDIRSATAIVRQAGQANGQLVCDILHVVRNGGTVDDVRAASDLIGYVQINDGPLQRPREQWWHEALHDRAAPGTGEFPLVDILRALAPGTVIEIEAPQSRDRDADDTPTAHLGRLVAQTRAVIARAFA